MVRAPLRTYKETREISRVSEGQACIFHGAPLNSEITSVWDRRALHNFCVNHHLRGESPVKYQYYKADSHGRK